MVDVASIAKAAFDGVSVAITDAVLDGVLNDGSEDYAGRVVFGGDKAPIGLPMAKASSKQRPAYLEGFQRAAQIGDTLTANSKVYHITGQRDIVEAGGLVVVSLIAQDDLLWKTADFVQSTRAPNGAGGYTTSEAEIAADISVGLEALSGRERWASDRVEALSDWRLWCKPVAGLTEKARAIIDGVSYGITFVNDIEERGVWQVIDLKRGVGQ